MAQTPNNQHGRRDRSDPSVSEDRNIARAINSLDRDYNAAQHQRSESDKRHLEWTRRSSLSAIAYTIFTVCLLGVSLYSAFQARDAIYAANRAAAAANSQANTSEDTEKRQLRAYVGVIPGSLDNFGQVGQTLNFIRKNYGHTPAYDVGFSQVSYDIINVSRTNMTPTMTCLDVRNKVAKLITIFPGAEMPFHIIFRDMTKPKDRINLVRGGTDYAAAYWGTICYHDAFGVPHYTHYCFMYKGQNMTAKDAEGCLGYNDSN